VAKKSLIAKAKRKMKFSVREYNAARFAAGRERITENLTCVEFVCGNFPCKVSFLV